MGRSACFRVCHGVPTLQLLTPLSTPPQRRKWRLRGLAAYHGHRQEVLRVSRQKTPTLPVSNRHLLLGSRRLGLLQLSVTTSLPLLIQVLSGPCVLGETATVIVRMLCCV